MRRRAPRVSVLLPVRNGMPWIERALASLLTQTYRNLEIVVLEDGSTDDTPNLVAKMADARLRVVPTGGTGIAHALNIGLAEARGEFIARQDADDESLPDRIDRQIEYLDDAPDCDVIATTAEYIDEGGVPIDNSWVRTVRQQQDPATTAESIRDLLPLTCCITHGSVMARADVLRAHGGYRPEMVPAEDYDLWLRLLPRHRFAKLPQRLYRYRVHDRQSAARARDSQVERAILAKLEYLRRVYPLLPARARLALAGGGRGLPYYATVGPHAGFNITDVAAPPHELHTFEWDVAAITDFGRLDAYRRAIGARRSGIEAVGNFFVRIPAIGAN